MARMSCYCSKRVHCNNRGFGIVAIFLSSLLSHEEGKENKKREEKRKGFLLFSFSRFFFLIEKEFEWGKMREVGKEIG